VDEDAPKLVRGKGAAKGVPAEDPGIQTEQNIEVCRVGGQEATFVEKPAEATLALRTPGQAATLGTLLPSPLVLRISTLAFAFVHPGREDCDPKGYSLAGGSIRVYPGGTNRI
jgi:hypothetical protein